MLRLTSTKCLNPTLALNFSKTLNLNTAKESRKKKREPQLFRPLKRWGEHSIISLATVREQMAKDKLRQLRLVYGRVARIEPGNKATVDVILKRRSKENGTFIDHIIPVVSFIKEDLKISTGDWVALKNTLTHKGPEKFGINPRQNINQQFKLGLTKEQVSVFGEENFGWGTDPDLKYTQRNYQPRTQTWIKGHYQPHGSKFWGQLRMTEKATAMGARMELLEKTKLVSRFSARDAEINDSFSKSDEVYWQVNKICHRAGFHVCPFHNVRVAGANFVDVDNKFKDGKLSHRQNKLLDKAVDATKYREWCPDYYFEVDHNAIIESEIHQGHKNEYPNPEGRRHSNHALRPQTIYEPDLNAVLFTTPLIPETIVDQTKKAKIAKEEAIEELNNVYSPLPGGSEDILEYNKKLEIQKKQVMATFWNGLNPTKMHGPKREHNDEEIRKLGYYKSSEVVMLNKNVINRSNKVNPYSGRHFSNPMDKTKLKRLRPAKYF